MIQESALRTGESELAGALWHKSSHSGSDNNCVEHGRLITGRQAVRDTKNHAHGTLTFTPDTWQQFVNTLRGNTL